MIDCERRCKSLNVLKFHMLFLKAKRAGSCRARATKGIANGRDVFVGQFCVVGRVLR